MNSISQRSDYYEHGKVVEKGSRDEELFSYLNYLYNNTKLGIDEISLLAHAYNQECFQPPLSDGVVDYKIRKCFEKERRNIIIVKI